MKNIRSILILVCVFCTTVLNAQIVSTVAGIADSNGAINGVGTNTTFQKPHGIAVAKDGNLYIADRDNNSIRKLDLLGNVTTIAGNGNVGSLNGNGSSATFNNPWGLAVDDDGNIFVADTRNHLIRKIDTFGVVSTYAGTGARGYTGGNRLTATFGDPTDIEIDSDGNLIICDHSTHLIRKITPQGIVSTIAGSPNIIGSTNGFSASFNWPYGIGLDSVDNIYVADERNHLIRKIDENGLVSTFAGTDGIFGSIDTNTTNAKFYYPWDVTFDNEGNLYIGDGDNHTIRKIDTDLQVMTLAGTAGKEGNKDGIGPNAEFTSTTGIVFNPINEALYVADAFSNTIRKIVITGENVTGVTLTVSDTLIELGAVVAFTINPQNFSKYELVINSTTVSTGSLPNIATDQFIEGNNTVYGIVTKDDAKYPTNIINVVAFVTPNVKITADETYYFEGDLATFTVTPNQFTTYNYYIDDALSITSSSNSHASNTLPVGVHSIYCSVIDTDLKTYNSDTITFEVRALSDPELTITEDSISITDSVLATVDPAVYDYYYWYVNDELYDSSSTASHYLYFDSIGTVSVKCVVVYDTVNYTTNNELLSINAISYTGQWQQVGKNDSIICISDSVTVTPVPNIYTSYQLNINGLKYGQQFANSINVTFNDGGNYELQLIAKDQYNNIIQSTPFQLNVTELNTDFTISNTNLDEENNSVTFTIDSLVDDWSYLWQFGDGDSSIEVNPTHEYNINGKHSISLTAWDEGLCADSTYKLEAITYTKVGDYFAPAAFSPKDKNGINDIFYIRGVKDPMELKIFNHWGEVIFTGTDVDDGWNGTYLNAYVTNSTYTYQVTLFNADGSINEILYGKVSIIK